MEILKFSFFIEVNDGFDSNELRNQISLTLEKMNYRLVDLAYKENGFHCPAIEKFKRPEKYIDTLTFNVEGTDIVSREVATRLHEIVEMLGTFRLKGGHYPVSHRNRHRIKD